MQFQCHEGRPLYVHARTKLAREFAACQEDICFKSRPLLVVERQAASALAGEREERVGYRGRDGRRARFSHARGFLAAGHVCTVAGYDSYRDFVAEYELPVVVTGFEPVDLLSGILECVRQLERGEATVANCYGRSAAAAGNHQALAIMDDVYEICDRPWRGLGIVPRGGFRLRAKWSRFDAEKKFENRLVVVQESCECRSGEVLTGRIKPTECQHFGVRCTPDSPLGAPMVSSEGACAAYFRYAPMNGKTKAQAV